VIVLALLASLLTPSPITPPEECTIPQSVDYPCSGVLLPEGAAYAGLRCLSVMVPSMAAAHERDVRYAEAALSSLKERLGIEIDRSTELAKLLSEAAPVERPTMNRTIWVVVGAAIGVAATLAMVEAVVGD
jgi:hypothetical protein